MFQLVVTLISLISEVLTSCYIILTCNVTFKVSASCYINIACYLTPEVLSISALSTLVI